MCFYSLILRVMIYETKIFYLREARNNKIAEVELRIRDPRVCFLFTDFMKEKVKING